MNRECIRYETYWNEGGQSRYCAEWSNTIPSPTTTQTSSPTTTQTSSPVVPVSISFDVNTTKPYILTEYPKVNRINATTAKLTLAFSRQVTCYWINVPSTFRDLTLQDIVMNPFTISENTGWGVRQITTAQEHIFDLNNLLHNVSYRTSILLKSLQYGSNEWSDVIDIDIPSNT